MVAPHLSFICSTGSIQMLMGMSYKILTSLGTPLTRIIHNARKSKVLTTSRTLIEIEAADMSTSQCVFCPDLGKYKCPACSRRTCSVQCCQRHKNKFSCSGERCQTISHTFIPLSEYTESTLLADYRHLERLSRDIDVIRRRRCQSRYVCHVTPSPVSAGLSVLGDAGSTDAGMSRRDQYRLRRALSHRSLNCRVMFLPPLFERHRTNTTHVDGVTGRIIWRVHWQMPTDRLSHTTDRMPDNIRLCLLVNDMLSSLQRQIYSKPGSYSALLGSSYRLAAQSHAGSPTLSDNDPISIYLAALENKSLCVFLRVEKDRNSNKYKRLNLARSLGWSLRNQCVVEYPTLLLVTSHNAHMFRPATSNAESVSNNPCLAVSLNENKSSQNNCTSTIDVSTSVVDSCNVETGAIYKQCERVAPAPRLDGVSVVSRDLLAPAPQLGGVSVVSRDLLVPAPRLGGVSVVSRDLLAPALRLDGVNVVSRDLLAPAPQLGGVSVVSRDLSAPAPQLGGVSVVSRGLLAPAPQFGGVSVVSRDLAAIPVAAKSAGVCVLEKSTSDQVDHTEPFRSETDSFSVEGGLFGDVNADEETWNSDDDMECISASYSDSRELETVSDRDSVVGETECGGVVVRETATDSTQMRCGFGLLGLYDDDDDEL